MRKEIVATAKTVEQAVEIGANELNVPKEDVTFEVLELPKKGFLGLGSTDAKVKVVIESNESEDIKKSAGSREKRENKAAAVIEEGASPAADAAVGFLDKIIKHMELDAEVKIIEVKETEIEIEIAGNNLGSLIGYHGEILDSLQYLTYLAVNREDSGGDAEESADKDRAERERAEKERRKRTVKISLDIENYRAKREGTLKELAKKMAERVLKYGRSVTLEPMNAYERRVIHATIQDIDGVVTHSIGQDSERKVIISKENKDRPPKKNQGSRN